MKKLFILLSFTLIIFGLAFTIPSSAFAQQATVTENELDYDFFEFPGFVDTNYSDIMTKGPRKPDSYWNLCNEYTGSAEWSANIYTNYYFTPNEDGEIKVSYDLDYKFDPNPERYFHIYLFKTSSKSIQGTYVRTVDEQLECSTVTFSNLDPNEFYYFAFSKTEDSETAELNFSVSR